MCHDHRLYKGSSLPTFNHTLRIPPQLTQIANIMSDPAQTTGAGQQDYLDKGTSFPTRREWGADCLIIAVGYGTKSAGHSTNASTTEKISDGIRTGFKKMTGKDVVSVKPVYSSSIISKLTARFSPSRTNSKTAQDFFSITTINLN